MSAKDIKKIMPKIQVFQHKRQFSTDKVNFPTLNINTKPVKINPKERIVQTQRTENQSPNDSINLNLKGYFYILPFK